ncbi:transporter substrate-binding domain-containing protein [Treponema pectinovorum]|uniref:transporter substrate-binding domain-containing protein n=1 Tax=Treponema pectinovorum TaxID=164 RepID=UPI0011CC4D24|nr:transporter substrate-binding domain-containing protein [Treponema pectinovorum]
MKKVLVLAGAALIALCTIGCSKKAEKGEFTIEKGLFKVGMEIGYPPLEYYDVDGKTPMGFDVELSKLLAKKMGLEAEVIDTAWDGIFAGLETNKYDAVIAGATITDERKNSMDFSVPYVGNGQALILKKDSKLAVSKPEDLTGLKVAYQAETTSDFFMEKLAAKGLKFEPCEFDKVLNAYDELAFGRCDVVISDALVSAAYLGPDSKFKCVWVGEADDFFGVAVKKGNKVLVDKVNQALKELAADGTLSELSKKIFGADLIAVK